MCANLTFSLSFLEIAWKVVAKDKSSFSKKPTTLTSSESKNDFKQLSSFNSLDAGPTCA